HLSGLQQGPRPRVLLLCGKDLDIVLVQQGTWPRGNAHRSVGGASRWDRDEGAPAIRHERPRRERARPASCPGGAPDEEEVALGGPSYVRAESGDDPSRSREGRWGFVASLPIEREHVRHRSV